MRNATITINGSKASEHTINPFLFGHFVEDIRDHMEAMLAYPLKDMDFESESEIKMEISGKWRAFTNGKNTTYGLEAPAPRHSGRAQRIRMHSDDHAYAGIAQQVAIKGPMTYAVKLVARASIELQYVLVDVVDRRTEELLGRVRIDLDGHTWRTYEAVVRIARSCEDAEVRIYVPDDHPRWMDHVSTGMLWFDHVSLLPEDHVAQVKREVFEMAKSLNAGMMRLAGNYISAYHWEDGIGPILERPVLYNEAWGGWTNKYFGTDEFIDFCRKLQVEPLICVNDGSGTPEEAARWVEYCNGGVDTPMGALRAANGHPEPYNVRYWEIGNEVWGPWQVGHCCAEEFAKRCVAFAKAMKSVDSSIVLLACGHTDQDWNKPVLDIAGEWIDYLTLHLYHGLSRFGMNRHTPQEERYKAIVTYPEWTHQNIRETMKTIRSQDKHRHVKLAITEYNTMYYPNTNRKGLPDEHTLGAAVANAANLNEMLRWSEDVHIGSFSDLVNGWLGGCIRVGDYYADQTSGRLPGWSGHSLTIYGTPTYEVLKLYANRDISRLLSVDVACDSFSVVSHTESPVDLHSLSDLDVIACVNESRSIVTLFVVNRSLEPVHANISLNGLEPSPEAILYEISGQSTEDYNSVFEPQRITCSSREISDTDWGSGLRLAPSSIYALEIKVK